MKIIGNRLVCACGFCLCLMGLVPTVRGQVALYVADSQSLFQSHSPSDVQSSSLVVDAYGSTPVVERDGKLKATTSNAFALIEVPEYEPVFVSVRDLAVQDMYLQTSGGGELNHTFKFQAVFESPFQLDHVFVVLELTRSDGGKSIFLHEVGSLAPRHPSPQYVEIPWSGGRGGMHYKFHLFTGGREVLQSLIPWETRERILDNMVAKRVANAADGPPRPFVGPSPEYPKALLKTNEAGNAVVVMHISVHGSVVDPQVQSASDPAFGTSAIEALRLWRFLPQIKNGKPVETLATIPVQFAPGMAKSGS